ncbi:hypothetical protein B0H10DRAFT_1970821 [Mycena sp. CBHHK59/15]|nr:hypothetical protein B0H10DRAFT_1970821 [Mycena sp. CBHHK59/15]
MAHQNNVPFVRKAFAQAASMGTPREDPRAAGGSAAGFDTTSRRRARSQGRVRRAAGMGTSRWDPELPEGCGVHRRVRVRREGVRPSGGYRERLDGIQELPEWFWEGLKHLSGDAFAPAQQGHGGPDTSRHYSLWLSPGRFVQLQRRGGKQNRELREEAAKCAEATMKPKERAKYSPQDTMRIPRDPRRGRSESAWLRHNKKYTELGGVFTPGSGTGRNTQPTERMTGGQSYPKDFVGFTKNAARVVRTVNEQFSGNPALLPVFSDDDSKIILVSTPAPTPEEEALCGAGGIGKWLEEKLHPRVLAAFKNLGPPPFVLGRFPEAISSYAQYRLIQAWDKVQALQPAYDHGESQRSSSPALHLGVWEHYGTRPIITGDSRQIRAPTKRREALVDALHELCSVIKQFIVPKLRAIVDWYLPGHEWIWEAMHQRIQKYLGHELAKYPNFDFGGVITMVACKEGGSEKIHIDWFDSPNLFAFTTGVGDFVGANLCTLQLGGQSYLNAGSPDLPSQYALVHGVVHASTTSRACNDLLPLISTTLGVLMHKPTCL